MRLRLLTALLALTAPLAPAAAPDFNRDIRPILSEACYHCHGPDAAKRKADLRLDEEKSAKHFNKDGLAAIIPGKSADSELIKRIFSTDPDEVMPTPKSNRHLTEAQKQLLKQWIDSGATWSRHWAFERIERPKVPAPPAAGPSPRNPIDAFILTKLAQEKLTPSPRADLPTLVRRIALDLTGLPPTPAQVDAATAAEQKLPNSGITAFIEQCLSSTRYGERWCWDWLDAARYADSNGYQGDPERTMWPWRDWVTNAINTNMPYDQFTVWQIAGDLLPEASTEQKLASGFNRNHMINGEGGRIAEETRVENVFDRVETTSTVWLGLTVGCCRCHDHKFDPLSQRDYFAMYDFFNQTSEDGKGRSGQAAPAMDLSTPAESERLKTASEQVARVAADVEAFELKKFPRPAGKPLSDSEAINLPGNLPNYIGKIEPKNRSADGLIEAVSYFKDRDPPYGKQLQRLLAAVRARTNATNNITKVMVMDTVPTPRETFILDKGAYDKPTPAKVTANVPASLPGLKPQGAAANRLDLALWLVRRDHPLTARVTVNRFWQAFFGVGLVKTAEDFGAQGENPVHRELLDWLAAEFIESGWDVKALHRLIVSSATYQQSSRVTPARHERDPDNRLLSRGPRYRMPSWMIRDQALFLSGLLKEQPGGPPVKPYQPEGIWEEATFGKKTYQQDHGDALYRRTLYSFWRRIVGPTTLFDNAARQVCAVKTVRTNTPLHALVTLNDMTYAEAARVMAQNLLLGSPQDENATLTQAFRRVTLRQPTSAETTVLRHQLSQFRRHYQANPAAAGQILAIGESPRTEKLDPKDHAAWTSLCLLLLNLDEALTKE
ncbi:MAG: PSD1 and planctomycete cytochrome C domain-containing protein [Prosthecobacter sp.]|nr:PSD1 and planctomycete cytochrome C domain-containing protein [Prosthecobacter sp.]